MRPSGAHVLASVSSQADARAIANLPGVTERGAPVPLVTATAGPRGSTDRVELAGLSGRTAVNMPVLTAGSPLREDGIVLERSLARALGIEVGATLLDRRGSLDLPVLGTAVVPSQPRYPRNPGLAWITRATLERIEPDRTRWPLGRFDLRIPPTLRHSASRRRQASRRQRGGSAISTLRPGKTSAITRSAMHSPCR